MKSSSYRAALCLAALLVGCVSERDHFYTLSPLPTVQRGALSTPAVQVTLSVTVPSLVDRSEMVLQDGDHGIEVLDHRRWGEPLADQVSQTLARDLEQRRSDVLVGGRGFDKTGAATVKIKVDIVRMSARMSGQATIEAHWRVQNENGDVLGGDSFMAPINGHDYALVAVAFSQTLASLADQLAATLPRAVALRE